MRHIFACVFSPTKPYTTCTPARSNAFAQVTLVASSNLACSSTSTATGIYPLFVKARAIQSTLLSYYERKLRLFPLGDPAATERALKRIFRVSRARELTDPASDFIRAHKRPLVDAISAWSGERHNQVARVVASLAQLCTTHRLVMRDSEERTLVPFSTFATVLIVNRLRTHSYRVTGP